MEKDELVPHLFRTEYRKIVAVLCKRFGFDQLENAEDIASETFLTASQAWGLEGVPKNPTGWLYTVAKNKAKNLLHREHLFNNKIAPQLTMQAVATGDQEIDLSPRNIMDSQLQMMFAICHPAIIKEAQIGLSLRLLCGFGIGEIADAFLTNKETINKRLFRAKEKLRAEKIRIEFPGLSEIDNRLDSVLSTIYLLFNEGYYSVSQNSTIRKDLCLEAMRLCIMLVENKYTNKPPVNALLSLICFHTSRFDARFNKNGELILYDEQDTSLWNTALVSKGSYYLNCASTGSRISKYHLEAGIAYWNTKKDDTKEKWENILQLYNQLLQVEYSPMAALNRTYALAKAGDAGSGQPGKGKQLAIIEAEKLQLTDNCFYFALLGELYTDIDNDKSIQNFKEALSLAKTSMTKQAIQKKLDNCMVKPVLQIHICRYNNVCFKSSFRRATDQQKILLFVYGFG